MDESPLPTSDFDGHESPQTQASRNHGLGSSISKAWLDPSLFPDQMRAFDDAWDTLVAREEWRDWVLAHLVPPSPFLVLMIRPGLNARRLRKTKTGVSMHLPATEVHEAHRSGRLVPLWIEVVHTMYSKWSVVSTCPPPPPPPETPSAASFDQPPTQQGHIHADAVGGPSSPSEAHARAVAWLATEQKEAAVTGVEDAGHSWRVFYNDRERIEPLATNDSLDSKLPILIRKDTGVVSIDSAWRS